MQCPKCMNAMLPVEFGTRISVMRCSGCHGLFCKRDVLEQMREEWLIDTVLDIGSAVEGSKYNALVDIPCPECSTTMKRKQDTRQTHVTLDYCTNCSGVFLDGGELTDLKNLTLMDQVRRLLDWF